MTARLLLALTVVISLIAPPRTLCQEAARELEWSEDLDYLLERLEVTHPNLYANVSRESYLESVAQLKKKIPMASDVEMFFGVQELLARIQNAHTLCNPSIFNLSANERLKAQFHYYPIVYYSFDDGLYIVATAEQYQAILGRKVVGIGNLASDEAMRELSRFVAGDNDMTILGNLTRFYMNDGQLLRHVGASESPDSIILTLENADGSSFDYEIVTDSNYGTAAIRWFSMVNSSANPTPLYRKHRHANYWFEHLGEERAVYLQINQMNNIESDPFPVFCHRLFDTLDANRAEKLIVDVRGCPGGDHIELPLLKGILARPHIDRADRLFLIIGRMTGSASEHLTTEFERYTNATLFGEATASKPNQYGDMERFSLPHSQLEIVCARRYFQDGGPSDYSMASTPDIYVARSSEEYRQNRDPVMERILGYDSYKHLKPAFKELMSKAYMDGGLDGFRNAYDSVKATYAKHGFNMENLLFKDLDAWMGDNSRSEDDYVEYLKFIHGELPYSTAVCYDLAYWMYKRGDEEEARRLYQRCLELNPEHHSAKWRLGLIEIQKKWPRPNR